MAYQVQTFQIAADAPLADQIAMKRAHIAHHESILARSQGSRWYDQSRRFLIQLRQELAELELKAAATAAASGLGEGP